MTQVRRNLSDDVRPIVGDPCGESQIRQNWLNMRHNVNTLNEAPRIFNPGGHFDLTDSLTPNGEAVDAYFSTLYAQDAFITNLYTLVASGGYAQLSSEFFGNIHFGHCFLQVTGVGAYPLISATFDGGTGEGEIDFQNFVAPSNAADTITVYCPRGMFSNVAVGDKIVALHMQSIYPSAFGDTVGNDTDVYVMISIDSSASSSLVYGATNAGPIALTGTPTIVPIGYAAGDTDNYSISANKIAVVAAGDYEVSFGCFGYSDSFGTDASAVLVFHSASESHQVIYRGEYGASIHKTRVVALGAGEEVWLEAYEGTGNASIEGVEIVLRL